MGLRRKNRKDYKASEEVKRKTDPMINPKVTLGAKILSFIVPKMFKDKNGKWSSRRTIGGVIAVAAVHQIEISPEITWQHLVMLGLAVATLYAAK